MPFCSYWWTKKKTENNVNVQKQPQEVFFKISCSERVILNYATSHNEPQRLTASHNEPQRDTESHNEPQKATTIYNEPQRPTATTPKIT